MTKKNDRLILPDSGGKRMTEHERLTRDTEFGQRAKVQRTELTPELTEQVNSRLIAIGKDLNPYPEVAHYWGSAAVHYYYTPNIQQAFFLCQTPLGQLPEALCQPGITELRNNCLEKYGHNPQRKRSGF